MCVLLLQSKQTVPKLRGSGVHWDGERVLAEKTCTMGEVKSPHISIFSVNLSSISLFLSLSILLFKHVCVSPILLINICFVSIAVELCQSL